MARFVHGTVNFGVKLSTTHSKAECMVTSDNVGIAKLRKTYSKQALKVY